MYLIVGFIMAILIILWGIYFYLVKTKKLKAEDWKHHALGLPQGSVRAILALAFVSTLICSAVEGVEIVELPDWAVGIVGAIVGFYFGTRAAQPSQQQSPEQQSPPSEDTNED